MTVSDALDRQAIRQELDVTLVVEAAAGTGKTTELVRRMVAVLRARRATVDTLVAVTFTEKAAGELKLRLRTALEAARGETQDNHEKAALDDALAHLEEAHINTIHGFCADLLRARPVEAGVDPLFEVMPEPDALALFRRAFDLWLQQQLANPPDGIRRALLRTPPYVHGRGRRTPRQELLQAAWQLVEWRDFPAPWRRVPLDRTQRARDAMAAVHAFVEATRDPMAVAQQLYDAFLPARMASEHVLALERVGPLDVDALEGVLVTLHGTRGFTRYLKNKHKNVRFYKKGVSRDDVFNAYLGLLNVLDGYVRDVNADLAALLHVELRGALERYQELKTRTGRVDFGDLLLRARDLLRGSAEVRRSFQRRFSHVFVDEFQDTDPIQAEVLMLLCAGDARVEDWRAAVPAPGKLFVVGDPKQSIYRFRRADVGIYQEVKQHLAAHGARVLNLSQSFRSVPNIQAVVNAAFAPVMDGNREALQAAYVPLAPAREDPTDQPSVLVLPVPRPFGEYSVTEAAVRESLPDAVGALVDWLVHHSGWKVTEHGRPDERVPIQPQHICLLSRRFSSMGEDVTRPYVQALEARGIPHLLVGGRGFHAREEVETLRAIFQAIEWPDDQLSVFAALHGSVFAIPDDVLLEWRHVFGAFHPFRVPIGPLPEHLMPVREALLLLRELHTQRNRCPVAQTVATLLERTRVHAAFVLRPSGEQALANVLHLADMARQYEAGGGISFRGFVEALGDQAEEGEASEAPILEEGSAGVRIMTVHRAKGLEFPVVILIDLTHTNYAGMPRRYVDQAQGLCAQKLMDCAPLELAEQASMEAARENAEAMRLTYVAATRARDLLVVPYVGDDLGREVYWLPNSWLAPLAAALVPPLERRKKPWKTVGWTAPTKDTVVDRAEKFQNASNAVMPGLYPFGSHQVTWFDPHLLTLDVKHAPGLRRQALLERPVTPGVVEEDLARWMAWKQGRQDSLDRGSQPSVRAVTVTAHAREQEVVPNVELFELPRDPTAPRGKRYGALVHAVLAAVPLDASGDVVAQHAALHARILGADREEETSAVASVTAALGHPVMRRACQAQRVGMLRRECPVTAVTADGTILEGVVDLAFEEQGTWTVVDFKTDVDPGVGLQTYKVQVDLYAQAITRATGQRAVGVLLRV